MKGLKFRKELADIILAGEKNVTWRLFDDKDLREGDAVSLINWDTGEEFAQAKLTEVREKKMGMWNKKILKGTKPTRVKRKCTIHTVRIMGTPLAPIR